MKARVWFALAGAALLAAGAFWAQGFLTRTAETLDADLFRAEQAFSADDPAARKEALESFARGFRARRIWISLLISDSYIHDLDRGLSRALRLAEEGQSVLAAEETADLREGLRDLSQLFSPTAENLLYLYKCCFSVENPP